MELKRKIQDLLSIVKEKNPLVHHITNYVTVNDCANVVLALGGSPVMADELSEVEEMVSIASALVLNMGTLNQRTIKSMISAGKKANQLGIPVIFDPVGVGATSLRTQTADQIIKEVELATIRGNMSEIKILSGIKTEVKGVDTTDNTEGGSEIARELAKNLQCTIAITGAIDIVSNGQKTFLLNNGHPLLAQVTGTGCMTTSLIGTYCGITDDPLLAAIGGILTMSIAGELAFRKLGSEDGIGTFRMKLFDIISLMTKDQLVKEAKIDE